MISIIAPMKNESENVESLVRELAESCAAIAPFEVILVDDGSDDGTGAVIAGLQDEFPWLRQLRHAQSAGQSAAVHSGVHAAKGDIICTLDGDGQNPPHEIPNLVAPFLDADRAPDLGLVAGQRVDRDDTWSRRTASSLANGLRSWLLKDGTRDTGCGLKAFRRDAFIDLPYFNHMHRYLPALFARNGWTVAHVDVTHRAREAGRSKYSNIGRALVGLYDLFGVAWLIRRRKTQAPTEIDRTQ
ncbi:glycosyltransferase family 2 protein [Marinibacterium sp. SX1]|uniref:glycosyltransferase family 2 protein n=1 Tax=Marinibacterium sp. SX1 TaxID=3388424 RepID=UPI003D171352